MGIGLYFYFERNPSAIERIAVEKTVRAFAGALSFENRKKGKVMFCQVSVM